MSDMMRRWCSVMVKNGLTWYVRFCRWAFVLHAISGLWSDSAFMMLFFFLLFVRLVHRNYVVNEVVDMCYVLLVWRRFEIVTVDISRWWVLRMNETDKNYVQVWESSSFSVLSVDSFKVCSIPSEILIVQLSNLVWFGWFNLLYCALDALIWMKKGKQDYHAVSVSSCGGWRAQLK